MLFGLMLKSANDVAHALGRDNAGTIETFARKMTRRAHELGATSTTFTNPHGLHHVEHFTTARDLAIITRAAMQQPFFRQIGFDAEIYLGTPKHPPETRELWNHNRLLDRFDGCTGVKTGYTRPAQHTLVTAAIRDRREVIAVVLHDGKLDNGRTACSCLSYGIGPPPVGALEPRAASSRP